MKRSDGRKRRRGHAQVQCSAERTGEQGQESNSVVCPLVHSCNAVDHTVEALGKPILKVLQGSYLLSRTDYAHRL